MSGHSHYATIKRQKEARDAQKGKIFSKLARAIQIAVKVGGGVDPETNYKLRMAIDEAKTANMPKDNIERAINAGRVKAGDLEELVYEGFGPGGISVIVEVATDNRNRTGQEIKNIFEREGGGLGVPGSVSFNFEPMGLILVKKESNVDDQMLRLIDIGADDVEESGDAIEVFIKPDKLREIREKIKFSGFEINSTEVTKRPKVLQTISEPQQANKALSFLEKLEAHEDVQKVYTNLDVPDEMLKNLSF